MVKYMKIVAQGSGKVLDAAMSDATVIVWEDNGGDNQLWYFDEDAAAEFQEKLPHSQTLPLIRNKNFPDLVSNGYRSVLFKLEWSTLLHSFPHYRGSKEASLLL